MSKRIPRHLAPCSSSLGPLSRRGHLAFSLPQSPSQNSWPQVPLPDLQAVTPPSAVLPVVEGGCDYSHQRQLRFNKSTLPVLCGHQDLGRHHRSSCPTAVPSSPSSAPSEMAHGATVTRKSSSLGRRQARKPGTRVPNYLVGFGQCHHCPALIPHTR